MKKTICFISLLSIVIYAEKVFCGSDGGKLPQDFSLFDGAHDSNVLQRDSIKDKFERYHGQDADYLDSKDLELLANWTMSSEDSYVQKFNNKKIAFILAFQKFIEKFSYKK